MYESFTRKIQVGLISDDHTFTRLKTFLCMLKPCEIVFDKENMLSSVISLLKSPLLSADLSPLGNRDDQWSRQLAIHYLDMHLNEKKKQESEEGNYPADTLITGLREQCEVVLETISGFYSYIERIMMIDVVIQSSEFIECDFDSRSFANKMMLDS